MADIIDSANDTAAEDLERRIAAARGVVAGPPRPMPELCENDCGEPPRERSRYCSGDCREDHEVRQLRLKRQGVR